MWICWLFAVAISCFRFARWLVALRGNCLLFGIGVVGLVVVCYGFVGVFNSVVYDRWYFR